MTPWVLTLVTNENLAFGQVAESQFFIAPHAVAVAPPSAIEIEGISLDGFMKHIWLGPGMFLNIESDTGNTSEALSVTWAEYTGMLNP